MSREDAMRKLLAAFRNMKADGTYWDVVVEAVAAFVDARIREAMVAHVDSAVHAPAPVQPEATAHKTSEGGAHRLVPGDVPLSPKPAGAPEEPALSQPAPVGAEAPERVWCRFYANGAIATHAEHREQADCYVRADVYEKAVEALRELHASYVLGCEDECGVCSRCAAVAFLAAHDAAAGRK